MASTLAQPKTSSIQEISAHIQKMPIMSWVHFLLERMMSYSTDKAVLIPDTFSPCTVISRGRVQVSLIKPAVYGRSWFLEVI